jgi:hypothetical protein
VTPLSYPHGWRARNPKCAGIALNGYYYRTDPHLTKHTSSKMAKMVTRATAAASTLQRLPGSEKPSRESPSRLPPSPPVSSNDTYPPFKVKVNPDEFKKMIKLGLKFHGNKRGQDYEITDPDPNLIKRMKENNITFQQIDSGKYKLIIFDVDSIFTEADVISSLERHLTVTKELRNFNVRRKNGRNFIIGSCNDEKIID